MGDPLHELVWAIPKNNYNIFRPRFQKLGWGRPHYRCRGPGGYRYGYRDKGGSWEKREDGKWSEDRSRDRGSQRQQQSPNRSGGSRRSGGGGRRR